MFLQNHNTRPDDEPQQPIVSTSKKYVYGLPGIARLFGCSIPTACRIKRSGKIDRVVTQIGRKIIVDADLALELAGKNVGDGRYGRFENNDIAATINAAAVESHGFIDFAIICTIFCTASCS